VTQLVLDFDNAAQPQPRMVRAEGTDLGRMSDSEWVRWNYSGGTIAHHPTQWQPVWFIFGGVATKHEPRILSIGIPVAAVIEL